MISFNTNVNVSPKLDGRLSKLLDTINSLHDANKITSLLLETLEVENVVYHCPTMTGFSIEDPFLIASYSKDWISHYKKNQYLECDPVVQIGRNSILPIDWNKLPLKNKKTKQLFAEAASAKLGKQGLSVPLRGPDISHWALFSITTNDSDRVWAGRRWELCKEVLATAYVLHNKFYQISRGCIDNFHNELTKREIEILKYIADGKTFKEVGFALNISRVTVKTHIESARSKLGALNATHAISKAMAIGKLN